MICLKRGERTGKEDNTNTKNQEPILFLIVTEGKRTEPLYFKGMEKIIKGNIGGIVDVIENPVIDIYGEGCSTGKLIEVTERIVKDAKINYQNIWVVFDKDDFEGFDVEKCKPSEYDPGTVVYKLVEELKQYIDE